MSAGKVRAHPDVVFQKLGDESVLLNLRTGVYWGLNPTGAIIWDEIMRHGDLARTATVLQEKFAGTPGEMRAAVHNLIADLTREGLVVKDD